jgi:23S rRNA pseudouridine1911/1915/1917 synthase
MISEDEIPEGYIEKEYVFDIPSKQKPIRIDQFLPNLIEKASRNRIQSAIEKGYVTVNGALAKASRKLKPGDLVVCTLIKPPPIKLIPQDIPIEIAYEDDYLLVVNKPAGIVTHPGFGNRDGTLINAVLWHLGVRENIDIETEDEDEENADEGVIFASDAVRPGMAHRLDKDTTGLLVVSKDPDVLVKLQKMFFDRTIKREYVALVWGNVKDDKGTITGNIDRSMRNRKKFEVTKKGGKPSITDYEVIERFDYLTLIRLKLRTGRTHQIRVHCSHNRYPLFGDPLYGGDTVVYGGHSLKRRHLYEKLLKRINRQMLHARTLGFEHPVTKEFVQLESTIPRDMQEIIEEIRNAKFD